MEGLEKEHAELFKKLMAERRVRPSLTLPLWDIGGFALGISHWTHDDMICFEKNNVYFKEIWNLSQPV